MRATVGAGLELGRVILSELARPTCATCGKRRPRFTAYCDWCWNYGSARSYGIEYEPPYVPAETEAGFETEAGPWRDPRELVTIDACPECGGMLEHVAGCSVPDRPR